MVGSNCGWGCTGSPTKRREQATGCAGQAAPATAPAEAPLHIAFLPPERMPALLSERELCATTEACSSTHLRQRLAQRL